VSEVLPAVHRFKSSDGQDWIQLIVAQGPAMITLTYTVDEAIDLSARIMARAIEGEKAVLANG
jgi:hypothetical protein